MVDGRRLSIKASVLTPSKQDRVQLPPSYLRLFVRILAFSLSDRFLPLAMADLRTVNELIAGSVGGAAQVLVGQPLDTIKTRAQVAPREFPLNLISRRRLIICGFAS